MASLVDKIKSFAPAALVGRHEVVNYKSGMITMQYRLLPARQDALEAKLQSLSERRDQAVSKATNDVDMSLAAAKATYDKAVAAARTAGEKIIEEAQTAYDNAYRSLMIEFGKPPTAEELAIATTPPGHVMDLRNAKQGA